MSRSEFIKYINSLSKDESKNELKLLYKKFKDVKKYYALELGSNEDRSKLYTKAKKEISTLFMIRGIHRKRPRIQKLNKLFSEHKKNAIFQHELIDLYLHTAQHAVDHIKAKRISDPVKNHLIKSFASAMKIIKESMMEDQYEQRSNKIIKTLSSFNPIRKELLEYYDQVYSS